MIYLYTLPNCGICHMVKTKLKQKNIRYEEKDFSEIVKESNTEYAPILKVIDSNKIELYTSPSEIVSWINSQEE